jgi:hypothetical protein|tara:strand:+ start:1432 stop:1653 length:222 start_codon:yes stop_codon:yes gene_type:complete
MEISRCDIMSVGKLEPGEIVAVISVVLLSGELGEAIAPTKGREAGSNWSVSHRMMASGNSSLLNSKSSRSSKR